MYIILSICYVNNVYILMDYTFSFRRDKNQYEDNGLFPGGQRGDYELW